MRLTENEEILDLEYNALRIIQDKNGYRFTSDAVILANLVKAKLGQNGVELGSGSGVISLLINAKTSAKMIGIEIQIEPCEMSNRSLELNKIDHEKVKFINADMKEIHKIIGRGYDFVVANPPYSTIESNNKKTEICSPLTQIDISKSEHYIKLKEVVKTAQTLLKFGGSFYVIYKSDRLCEIINACKEYKIEPKNITLVQPKASKNFDTVIVRAVMGAKVGVKIDSLIVYNDDGSMTEAAKKLYHK